MRAMIAATPSATLALAAAIALAVVSKGAAQVPMSGRFMATAACPATPSVRGAGNPGEVALKPGTAYELFGRNASPGSHFLVRVPGSSPERRWVAFDCGSIEGASGNSSAATPPGRSPGGAASRTVPAPASSAEAGKSGPPADFVLAASWHPAFCETRPRAADCRNGGETGGFTLHGLWPQPRGREYCNVDAATVAIAEHGKWRDLPAPDLSDATRHELARVMPGMRSGLERHEWWKHGTCHGGGADDYFTDAARLLDELNASAVAKLFERSVGERVEAGAIRAAFDEAFGRGAGRHVFVSCVQAGGRRMIGELRIAVRGSLVPAEALRDLMAAAPPAAGGCRSGEVDAAGFR